MIVIMGTTTLSSVLQQQKANAESPREQDSKGNPHNILSIRTVEGPHVTISPGVSSPSVPHCDSDELQSGGGFRIIPTDSTSRWQIEENDAGTSQAWLTRAQNTGSNTITLVGSVQCAKLVPPP
jgi:hypothetical protein